MLELPNLEGQPAWVIIVVVALVVGGGLGIGYLRWKAGQDPEEPAEIAPVADTVALPTGSAALDGMREAMNHLAAAASREAKNADESDEEARVLRQELAECARERTRLELLSQRNDATIQLLQARLEACEAHTRLIDDRTARDDR